VRSKAIVFYDGDCSLCRASVDRLTSLDHFGRLEFRNIRDPEVLARHPEIDRQRALARMQLLPPEDRNALEGFEAFRWIAGRLPGLWIFVPFLWLPGMSWIGSKVYDRIARGRSMFGSCDAGKS
jgi:predicted DCC family thiol-disulfide oxidoreductase YuxK